MKQVHLRVVYNKATVELSLTGDVSEERVMGAVKAVLQALDEQDRLGSPELNVPFALLTPEAPQPCMDCGPGLENSSKVLTG